MSWDRSWKLIGVEISIVNFWEMKKKGNEVKLKSEFLIGLSHRYCKLFKFPIWVGIAPDNWLEWRYLFFYFIFYFVFGVKIEEISKSWNRNENYKVCKLVKCPSWVGIVHENWLE